MKKEQSKIETLPEKKEEIKDEELELERRLESIGSDKETEIMAKLGKIKDWVRVGEAGYGKMTTTGRQEIKKDLTRIFNLKEGALFRKGKVVVSADALEDVKLHDETMWEIYGKARGALRGASNEEEELGLRTDHISNAIKYLRLGGYLKREWIVRRLEDLAKEHPRLAKTIHDTLDLPARKF